MRKLASSGFFRSMSIFFSMLAFLLIAIPASAHPAIASAPLAGCNSVELTLHGTSTPSSACLDKTSGVSPQIVSRRCGSDGSDLVIYWNGPIDVAHNIIPSGPLLCIRGIGTLDLTGTQPDGRNWNDKASAWWAGCSNGEFWLNTGHNWPWEGVGFPGGSGTFASYGNFPDGNVGNDQLSEVQLYSDC